MRPQLRRFGGSGLFATPLSTSNLHTPAQAGVLNYLKRGERKETNLLAELSVRLCAYHAAKKCVLFSTGFWALVAAIKLRALAGRKQVIIPSFTYRRLADVVFWAGLVPVFVDVNADDLAVSTHAVAENIGPETALILAVHPIVNCCAVTELIALAERTGVPVIFDAVESAHETYSGQRVGSFGVGEVFSLHASKLLNGLEGGYVCTDDDLFAAALEKYCRGWAVDYRGATHQGLNGLPHPAHAAFALAGLDDLADNIAHNRTVYCCYRDHLRPLRGIRLLEFDEHQQTSFKNIVIEVTQDFPVSRDALCAALNYESILARKHYHPPLHRKKFSYPVIIRAMSHTERAESRYLNLPCGARVSEAAVRQVCDFISLVAAEPATFHETSV